MPGKVERGVGVGFDSRAGDVRLTVRISEPNARSCIVGVGSSIRSRLGGTFMPVGGGIETSVGATGSVGSAGGNADSLSGDGGTAGIGGSEAGLAASVSNLLTSNLFSSWGAGGTAFGGDGDCVTGGARGADGPSGLIVAGVDGAGNAGVAVSVGTTGSNVGGVGTGRVGTGEPGTDGMAGSGMAEVIGSEWDA